MYSYHASQWDDAEVNQDGRDSATWKALTRLK